MTTPEHTDRVEQARHRIEAALFEDVERRVNLRGHALYAAAMTFAERGERASTQDVLARADAFLDWLTRGGDTP